MKTVKYGDWKIAVDIEKTKEFYSNYVINDTQANRNFAEYCKNLTAEEKGFFDSFGITPECCDIHHNGVNKKKELPCGGYYLFCGYYLEHPNEQLITVEELVKNNFVDNRKDPRINIGVFQFDFQCEDYYFKIIPKDIPQGFLCVRFWCQSIKWLISEKPDDIMYVPPKFWEFWRIIKQRRESRIQCALYLEENKEELKTTFERLNIQYSLLTSNETERYKRNWIRAFSPKNAKKKEIKKLCLINRKFRTYLWNIFAFGYIDSCADASEHYNERSKHSCVLLSNVDNVGYALTNAEKLTSHVLDELYDVTVSDSDFLWTYCKTHDGETYFYFKNK